MIRPHLVLGLVALLAVPGFSDARSPVDVAAYTRPDSFEQIKISPDGRHIAATVPLENGESTALVVMDRNNTITGKFSLGRNSHVAAFHWVNDERLLIAASEKLGRQDAPQLTGELYAMNADGGSSRFLVGQRMMGEGAGTRIQTRKVERVAAFLIDDLPDDERSVLVSIWPFHGDPYTRVDRMDVYSGRRVAVARAPVRNASFVTDNNGEVRFAVGHGTDRNTQLYYREAGAGGSDWRLVNDQDETGIQQYALGFSADNTVAYLQTEKEEGPDAILAMDVATGETREVLRDDTADPYLVLTSNNSPEPVGVLYQGGRPRTAFFDEASADARLYRSLEAAFPDPVRITSQTRDGGTALVHTWSDRNPGDFYLFDNEGKRASLLLSSREWFDPREMAERRPFRMQARDGTGLHGFLTVPNGSEAENLPMVVMPHGGPFGIQDTWRFDDTAQMLAEAGYLVLQVNFRGSGGYGRAFHQAGARQWGRAMQDDVTDATRWAIAEGIADPSRICIAGGSYGGYAALMGVVREPDLYQCAVGYIGVYDLPTMHSRGDVQTIGSGETFLREWLGEGKMLEDASPNRLADRIKVPVFLAAGGQDERAPIAHSHMMERALKAAGVPVETLYYPTEGHGFYRPEHQREYYTRLLAFLARSLGGAVASTAGDDGGTPAPDVSAEAGDRG